MDKDDFLLASINDIQSTIRAIDVKVSFLLLLLVSPLAMVDKIFLAVLKFQGECFFTIPFVLTFIIWLVNIILTLKAITSTVNPYKKVDFQDESKNRPTGVFFSADLFDKANFFDSKLKSKKTFEQRIALLPDIKIQEELLYEQMKCVFIRDYKFKIQKIPVNSNVWGRN